MSVSASTTYLDFTRWRSERNPCLKPLVEFLGKWTSSGPSTIYNIDYTQSPASEVQISSLPLEQLLKDVDTSAPTAVTQRPDCRPLLQRVVLVEDIDALTMHTLGTHFDIDPLFFAHYMFTELRDIESSPPPPALGSLPSTFISKTSIHLHYQQILNLRRADFETDSIYKLQALGNVKRTARCTPPISGTQPVILRGCCSAILKHFDKGWVCLILLDSLTDLVPQDSSRSFPEAPRKQSPFQGGLEDFISHTPFSVYAASSPRPGASEDSILRKLLRYYEERPPGFDANDPNLLSLVYYPIRWVSSNWMLYVLLVNRYYKSHEYSVNRSGTGYSKLETNLIDLQRWRRRTKQSLNKLNLITESIRLHLPASQQYHGTVTPPGPATSEISEICATLLSDYAHITDEIKDYRQSMDFLISISTTMFQSLTARQSIQESVNIRRLTYVALFSAPIGLVAAVFSMSAEFLPGRPSFWIFALTAVLATSLVVGVALTPGSVMRRMGSPWADAKSPRYRLTWKGTDVC